MNCLPCFQKNDDDEGSDQPTPPARREIAPPPTPDPAASSKAQTFTFRELAMATKNFRQECLLGEGGFGRVFKGKLQSTGQVVAVKQLDRNGMQGNKEFLVEVLMLSLLQDPNLVSLIGYCADGDQRLLVYEYMPMGSLENHLFGDVPDQKPIDWFTRMKIASGAAKGLEYLHDRANPPIIYRDLKPSNILLDETYEPKLSDFGLAKLGAGGGKINPTSRVMGTYGYSAPEYSSNSELTLKSDIYSFGVVLLELITGRKVIDTTRPNDEQNLVTWAQPIFREPKRFPDLADPRLNKEFPVTALNQAVGVCAMCLQEEPTVRPLIGDVVAALSFLAIPQPLPAAVSTVQKPILGGSPEAFTPPQEQKMEYGNEVHQSQTDKDSSSNSDGSSDSSEDQNDPGSVSEQRNGGSSLISGGERSSHYSEVESGRQSDGEIGDSYSEEESSNSDSDGSEDSKNDDGEASKQNLERAIPETSTNVSHLNSSQISEVGNRSSHHGSGRNSSPTKRTGSRRRKMVVTFKEPNLSRRKNKSNRVVDEQSSYPHSQPTPAKVKQRSDLSSSSESSSDSEDEKNLHRHKDDRPELVPEVTANLSSEQKATHKGPQSSSESIGDLPSFPQPAIIAPKLRHLQTR